MILTVGADDGLRERVVDSLRDTQWATTVATVPSVGEALEILRGATPPRVVIVGSSLGVESAGDVAAVASTMRTPPLVLLIETPTTEVLRAAMRAGVRDVLPADFEPQELVDVLVDAGVTGGGPPALPGLTVAVFSTKGGVGTSVLASNLAVLLGERVPGGATLVDLDLASGDQSIMHGISPRWTIQDLADGSVGLDEESLQQVLVDIEDSESRLLPGPVDPALSETITAADVSALIAAVRAQSRVAVLDTASGFDERTLTALDAADVVVLVSSLDVAALRSLTVSLQTLERLGIDRDAIITVLVRVDSKSGLVVGDVERAINGSVDVGVPSTRNVPRSVNEGVPIAIGSRRSSVVSAFEELTDLLVARLPDEIPVEERASSGGGLFPWSRSKRSTRSSGDTSTSDAAAGPGTERSDDAPEPAAAVPVDESDEPVAVDDARASDADPEEQSTIRSLRSAARTDDDPEVAGERDAPAEEPQIRAVASLDELPPPLVDDDDDDDDEPRRRRHRR